MPIKYMRCHGCGGRGWVEVRSTKGAEAVSCPVCHGKGYLDYDPRRGKVPADERCWL